MFRVNVDLFEVLGWVVFILMASLCIYVNHHNRNRLEFDSATITEKDVKKAIKYMLKKGKKPPFTICIVRNYRYRPLDIYVKGDTAEEIWQTYMESKGKENE